MTHLTWKGDPIHDSIRVWAALRGEQIVRFRATRRIPSLTGGGLIEETYVSEVPESIWDNIAIRDGWVYTELERATPPNPLKESACPPLATP